MGIKKKRKETPEKPKIPEFPKVSELDKISVIKQEEFYPHFVYSNSQKRVIGSVYLTENQANCLNKIMQNRGVYNQDIAFLRKA